MDIPFFDAQAQLLHWIASLRSEWLDPIFLFLNYFDSEYFLMIIIPCIWIGISNRWGLRIAILLIFSSLINQHLKYLLNWPRPIVAFPNLPMILFTSPGFPSGAAQNATLLAGLLVHFWKSGWAWVIALPYAAIICFSRLYLGVHYPMDLLGGIAVGLALLFLFTKTIYSIDEFCYKQGRGFCLLLCVLFCFFYALLVPSSRSYQLMGALLGFGLGAYASSLFGLNVTWPRSTWIRCSSAIASIAVLFVLYRLTLGHTVPAFQAFLLSLWISLGASPFCRAVLRPHSS